MFDELQRSVEAAEKMGAEFVEARFEDLTLRTLERTDDIWKDIQIKSRMGIAITSYVEGVTGFSFSASTKTSDILVAAEKSVKMAKASSSAAKLKLPFEDGDPIESKSSDTLSVKIHPRDQDLGYKTDLVNRMVETAREHGESIRNIRGLYGELYGTKQLVNSDGSKIDWQFLVTDLRVSVTSMTQSGAMVRGADGKGGTHGLEIFSEDETTPEAIGEAAGSRSKEQLKAKACPAGKFRSLIENRLVGVLAHESFGHLSEADFIVTGGSPLTEKLGTTLGTEHATIYDGGNVDIDKYGGLWLPYDDQGIPTSITTVLKEGVLKHYLHNRGTAAKVGQDVTGNARAVTFAYPPICRMTNTYFAPGDLTEEEALELLDTGVYAIQSMGGQVQGDGSFLFKAIRGYWVERGQIQYPIREVALSGNILELLSKVEGGTKELKLSSGYFGGCGKGDQFPLPTGLGGPMLVIDGVTFGGEAG
ncbi:MAG: TldD/PmbA family protein [Candidatus Thorarchaeota archaeon]|nr:MAG: TldD/PmbA family protein [Candidatus Thorarchaeota archaeon]